MYLVVYSQRIHWVDSGHMYSLKIEIFIPVPVHWESRSLVTYVLTAEVHFI